MAARSPSINFLSRPARSSREEAIPTTEEKKGEEDPSGQCDFIDSSFARSSHLRTLPTLFSAFDRPILYPRILITPRSIPRFARGFIKVFLKRVSEIKKEN